MHRQLKYELLNCINDLLRNSQYVIRNQEPILTEFYKIVKPSDIERRADIQIVDTDTGNSILIDCTITCPAAHRHKSYNTAGDAANEQVCYKTNNYRSYVDIDDPSNQHSLFFFAVESSGALSDEAIHFCKFLAEISGKEFSSTCQFIYQRISCRLQAIRAAQVIHTIHTLTTTTPPARLSISGTNIAPNISTLVPLDSG